MGMAIPLDKPTVLTRTGLKKNGRGLCLRPFGRDCGPLWAYRAFVYWAEAPALAEAPADTEPPACARLSASVAARSAALAPRRARAVGLRAVRAARLVVFEAVFVAPEPLIFASAEALWPPALAPAPAPTTGGLLLLITALAASCAA